MQRIFDMENDHRAQDGTETDLCFLRGFQVHLPDDHRGSLMAAVRDVALAVEILAKTDRVLGLLDCPSTCEERGRRLVEILGGENPADAADFDDLLGGL